MEVAVENAQIPGPESIYQPRQSGLKFPEMPAFKNVAEDRQYRKEHLVAACRAFAQHGFDYGFGGHLTVRDPEFPELYWTNPMAVHFSQVKISNLVLANHEGKVMQGTHAINHAGFVLHGAVHHAHPDIVAMCHAHTFAGTAWAAFGRTLEPISQDAACFFEDHVVLKDGAGAVPVNLDAGVAVAAAIGSNKALIHQNHGLITASRHSIDEAAFWFIALDRCCKVQLDVEATGRSPAMVPREHALFTRQNVGTPFIAWLHFQTIYGQLVETHPNMFD
jgi:ribulose-5-phosphate 4-epimerase/fuculose-1-phosphate aldolase